MDLPVLAKTLNDQFGPPFLPDGHVRAEVTEHGSLKLFIGRRDIDVADDGSIRGAGTCLVGKTKWLRP